MFSSSRLSELGQRKFRARKSLLASANGPIRLRAVGGGSRSLRGLGVGASCTVGSRCRLLLLLLHRQHRPQGALAIAELGNASVT